MSWIKRNLFFVIGSVIALGLLAWAGFYNFTRWKLNADARENLNKQYEELKRLNNLNPHPGNNKVDNIAAAREQRDAVVKFTAGVARQFQPIPSIPPPDKLNNQDFAAALRQTIDKLQRDANNASVALPPQYSFSFLIQRSALTLSPGSLEPLSTQLGEIKAICDLFNTAKVNSFDGIRRERVCTEDMSPQAQPTDYLDIHSQTNEQAVITPYEVTFRCFTPELALVISGLANSPHAFVVRTINVEPAPAVGADGTQPSPYGPGPTYGGGYPPPLRRGYGEDEGMIPRPAPPVAPVAQAAGRGGLQTFINERQLRVTLLVEVVKLLPKK